MNTAPNGLLLVDKAEGWTSHDVVAKARRALGTRKVGHAGTLDPMATGLLLLGVGQSTRLLTHLVGLDKTYTATIRLGVSTVSDDREGQILDIAPPEAVQAVAADPDRILAEVERLTGEIEQVPSAVSAIKVEGRRAYDLVREGEQVQLKKRPVTVHSFVIEPPRVLSALRLNGGDLPVDVIDVDAIIECSSGTYVRALARDLGEALGVGGHLVALRRMRVGMFDVSQAVTTDDLVENRVTPEQLLSPAAVATRIVARLDLTEQQAIDVGHGKRVDVDPLTPDADVVAAIAPNGRLVGLVEVNAGRTRVVTNFPQSD